MLAPLERLFQLGRREALAELKRLGYEDAKRSYAAEPKPPRRQLRHLVPPILEGLHGLALRIELERVQLDVLGPQAAIIEALYLVPGARNIASQVVSSALTAGLADTFEANRDLVTCWEYTAVLDANTCGPCEIHDGEQFATLDGLYEVLPNFGPNPDCLGEGRCRCRGVPCGG